MARKSKATKGAKTKKNKTKSKRKLSDWNLFVMKIKKLNPTKSFGEVLKIASTEKKKGKMKV
jgi:hypothetical protein